MSRIATLFRNVTTGGQVTDHDITMFTAVFQKTLGKRAWLLMGLSFGLLMYCYTTPDMWQAMYVTTKAYFCNIFPSTRDVLFEYHFQNQIHKVSIYTVFHGKEIPYQRGEFLSVFFGSISVIVIGWLLATGGLIWFYSMRGASITNKRVTRGRPLAKSLRNILPIKERGPIKIGGFTFMKGKEARGWLLHGTTGVGKTIFMKRIIRTFVIPQKHRAIIFDDGGEFVKTFYRPPTSDYKGDVILSTFDERSAAWDLWLECKTLEDFENFANYLMPMVGKGDPFWTEAARGLFVNIAMKLGRTKSPTYGQLINYCLNISIDALEKYLKQEAAARLIDKDARKTAVSVLAVLATHVKPLRYLTELTEKNQDNRFCISEWVQNEKKHKGQIVFIPTVDKHHNVIKSLITAWISIFSMNAKSKERDADNKDNRIWFMLDELPKLNYVADLEPTLSRGRNYGICTMIGIQNKAQLRHIYGENLAVAILDLLSTKLYFRSTENAICDDVSKQLGEYELLEYDQTTSFGANPIRDGKTLTPNRKTKRVVYPDEIRMLPDLECYIQLPTDAPVAKVSLFSSMNKERKYGDSKKNMPIQYKPLDGNEIVMSQVSELEKLSERLMTNNFSSNLFFGEFIEATPDLQDDSQKKEQAPVQEPKSDTDKAMSEQENQKENPENDNNQQTANSENCAETQNCKDSKPDEKAVFNDQEPPVGDSHIKNKETPNESPLEDNKASSSIKVKNKKEKQNSDTAKQSAIKTDDSKNETKNQAEPLASTQEQKDQNVISDIILKAEEAAQSSPIIKDALTKIGTDQEYGLDEIIQLVDECKAHDLNVKKTISQLGVPQRKYRMSNKYRKLLNGEITQEEYEQEAKK
jgi:type IV conjugative transfer system coupling protein TraD